MRKLITKYFCVSLTIFLLSFSLTSVTSYAKSNLSVLRNGNGGFLSLSEQDKQDTIVSLVNQVSKDLHLKETPTVSFYDWPESATLAYNTMWCNIICVNMSGFRDAVDATAAGETVEYHVVKTIAHEVRHSYQFQHMKDDSDYGRACYAEIEGDSYTSYTDSLSGYFANFTEQDAMTYGVSYANKYVKNGLLTTKTYVANNGKAFDPVFYANTYQDVKNVLGTDPNVLLDHYNTYGIKEGRKANANDN